MSMGARTGEKPLILIVEPLDSMAHIVALMLQHMGYRTRFTSTMFQAVEVAWTERPDLVLTNDMLPDGSGFELCRQMRHNARLCAMPVVMWAGHEVSGEALKAAGIDLFLPMPVQPPDLRASIQPLIENYAAFKASNATVRADPTLPCESTVEHRCAYDALKSSRFPECSGAEVMYRVAFADGTVLKLCKKHADWYRKIHPMGVPMQLVA